MLVVLNPTSRSSSVAQQCERALRTLEEKSGATSRLYTAGDGGDIERIAAEIHGRRPRLVIAAGGDGTVRDVTQAMMEPASAGQITLGILPLGTANNIGRSLGLTSFRQGGETAVRLAARTILDGAKRRIDLGRCGPHYFVGSLAVGMDADILHTRNRLRQRLRLDKQTGGYPLYLFSCAMNVLRTHGGKARLCIRSAPCPVQRVEPEPDGERNLRIYNLLVTNTPIYAGEFRFDAENSADDGLLDLHLFTGAADYLVRYPLAWRRHVRHSRGVAVRPPRRLDRIRELTVDLARPVPWQLDGEEMEPASSYHVEVVASALPVLVPE